MATSPLIRKTIWLWILAETFFCVQGYIFNMHQASKWNQGSLAKQFGERYRHIKALGNWNYKNPDAPIEIVDLDEGIRQIEALLRQFSHVIAMCVCPQLEQYHRAVVAHEANYRLLIPIRELYPPQLDGPQMELFMHKQEKCR